MTKRFMVYASDGMGGFDCAHFERRLLAHMAFSAMRDQNVLCFMSMMDDPKLPEEFLCSHKPNVSHGYSGAIAAPKATNPQP